MDPFETVTPIPQSGLHFSPTMKVSILLGVALLLVIGVLVGAAPIKASGSNAKFFSASSRLYVGFKLFLHLLSL